MILIVLKKLKENQNTWKNEYNLPFDFIENAAK